MTIVAVGSPPSPGDLGIIRVSGADARPLLDGIVALNAGRGVMESRLQLDEIDLPCTTMWMPGPGSYTGEDVAELVLPGNPLLLERLTHALIDRGVCGGLSVAQALPGEFTFRAWRSGRLTLAQAEAIMAKVHAESDAALQAAHRAEQGALHASVSELAAHCRDVLALVEAGIDFTDEEDVVIASAAEVEVRVERIRGLLGEVSGADMARADVDERPLVRLCGRPSAGKSTLFNALLGQARSVEMAEAHTTRDEVVEPLTLPGGRVVRLADTPGTGALTHEWSVAELTVWCVPCDDSDVAVDAGLLVRTKADLAASIVQGLAVCAHSGDGLDELRVAIDRALLCTSGAAEHAALSARHRAALSGVDNLLREAADGSRQGPREQSVLMPECVAMNLRHALDRLGDISGEIPPDDVLGVVFASFCVGK